MRPGARRSCQDRLGRRPRGPRMGDLALRREGALIDGGAHERMAEDQAAFDNRDGTRRLRQPRARGLPAARRSSRRLPQRCASSRLRRREPRRAEASASPREDRRFERRTSARAARSAAAARSAKRLDLSAMPAAARSVRADSLGLRRALAASERPRDQERQHQAGGRKRRDQAPRVGSPAGHPGQRAQRSPLGRRTARRLARTRAAERRRPARRQSRHPASARPRSRARVATGMRALTARRAMRVRSERNRRLQRP